MASVILGKDLETGEQVVLEEADRRRGMYIIGKPGTGKTTLIESLAAQDMDAGLGICVLDPHGDLIDHLLARVPPEREKDVVLLDPRDTGYPFGLNVFDCADPTDTELTGRIGAQFVELFEKLWGTAGSEGSSWGPRIPMLLRNIAGAFMGSPQLLAHPGLTMVEIPMFLGNAVMRTQLIKQLDSRYTRQFWEDFGRLNERQQGEQAGSTLNKLDEFLSQPIVENIVGQARTTANFRDFMDEGKIVLVPLGIGRLGEPVVELLGSLIVLQILNAALSREDLPERERRQFNLYADEYQRFSTPAFATLLAEARKYAVATTIAHQARFQLDESNREAALHAGNLVVFGVQGEDAEEMAKEFDNTPPTPPIIGMKPELNYHINPLEHLLNRSHGSDDVTNFVHVYLRDIHRLSTVPLGHLEPGRVIVPEHLVVALEKLNFFFYSCMDRTRSRLSRHTMAIDAVKYLLNYLNLHAARVPLRETFGQRSNFLESLVNLDRNEERDALVRYFYPEDAEASRSVFDQATQLSVFLLDLYRAGDALEVEPIMVDTGSQEPIYDSPRSYADVEAEIASSLVRQQPFQAKCKIGHEGLESSFEPLFEDFSENVRKSDVAERIREQSRLLYCREKTDVQAEMEARWRIYQRWEDPETGTTVSSVAL